MGPLCLSIVRFLHILSIILCPPLSFQSVTRFARGKKKKKHVYCLCAQEWEDFRLGGMGCHSCKSSLWLGGKRKIWGRNGEDGRNERIADEEGRGEERRKGRVRGAEERREDRKRVSLEAIEGEERRGDWHGQTAEERGWYNRKGDEVMGLRRQHRGRRWKTECDREEDTGRRRRMTISTGHGKQHDKMSPVWKKTNPKEQSRRCQERRGWAGHSLTVR